MKKLIILADRNGGYDFSGIPDRTLARNNLFDNMIELIGEDMRKKRREAHIRKVFNEPFVEDVPTPFIGYKKLLVANWRLFSGHDTTRWEMDGSLVATCEKDLHFTENHDPEMVPWPSCSCGIYAYSKLGPWVSSQFYNRPSVLVELEMGGFVVPHTYGYRASIAKITKVYSYNSNVSMSEVLQICNDYNIPVDHASGHSNYPSIETRTWVPNNWGPVYKWPPSRPKRPNMPKFPNIPPNV